LSELAANARTVATGSRARLRILGFFVLSIAAVGMPVLLSVLLYSPEGISLNGLVSHLFLPTANLLIMLLIVLLARRTRSVGTLDLVWFRRGRFETAAVFLLPLAALLLIAGTIALMEGLGLKWRSEYVFAADGKRIVFFVALTVSIVVATPILEELFWRGYVQRVLERLAGPFPAVLGQAVLFAAIRLPPFGRFGPALALGLVVGTWRWKRRTLVPIILAHMVLNGLYCAAHWPHWLDCTKIRVTTDYVAQMAQAARPPDYNPNDDAREHYEQAFQAVVQMPPMLGAYRGGFPTEWSEEAFAQLRRWVAANEEALEHMTRGTRRACYQPIYTGATAMLAGMPDASGIRNLAFVLDLRIKLRAFDGQDEQFLADAATLYRFARHFEGPRALVHQLIGVSIRSLLAGTLRGVLARESFPPETLTAFQRQLEQLTDEGRNVLDFTLERLVWLDGIQRIFTDEGDGQGRVPRPVIAGWERLPGPFQRLIDPMTPEQNAAFLALDRLETSHSAKEFLGHIERAAATTPWAFYNEPDSVWPVLNDLVERNAYIELLGIACLKIIELPWRAAVELDALVATIAAIRYEDAHADYPDSLERLVETGYLRHVPQDPYSNDPLLYRRAGGGFLLYSRGLNFDDDGGAPSRWGEGPEGGDQVFWPVR
jgi:membrane protease YdiL (CAAX protease family)